MALPLGVVPATGGAHAADGGSLHTKTRHFKSENNHRKATCSKDEPSLSKGPPSKEQSPSKVKFPKSLSSKTLAGLAINKRARADSSPAKPCSKSFVEARAESTSTQSAKQWNNPRSGSRATSFTDANYTRPRHVPIVIPSYVTVKSSAENRSDSLFEGKSGEGDRISVSEFLSPTCQYSLEQSRSTPRHVEIKIPDWARPVLKQAETPPQITLCESIFDPFANVDDLTPVFIPSFARDSTFMKTMESRQSGSDRLYVAAANSGSQSYLVSTNSSQSSLVSQHDNDESASEAESTNNDDNAPTSKPSHASAASQASNVQPSQTTPNTNPAHLSGLVCNVHRTTGKEPPPLVGATTTILGDKLYVFGGRRLSRSKPQLTSNVYELDLIRRHWTKLEVTGEVPPPRYFHSVCALGHTKLVCYGGMSPAPSTVDTTADAQPEVIVMSDVHIFDVPTKSWMKIKTPDAPQGRYAHCAAILPSSAVFASANAPMSAVLLNPSSGKPNQGSLGVAIDGTGGAEMVVVGGQDSANHYIEQISVFNLRSLKWTGTTGMGRSCGAYRSVVTPLTSMSASQIGAGPHARSDLDEDDEEPAAIGSGAPMLIYSNYNFLDVKLELQVRQTDGQLSEKPMQTAVSPPGLRFPNGGVIANHFVVSGTFLTSSKQEYALWALDLRTLTWSRIDAGGSIFGQGSWNRGVLWNRRNAFVILGNRKRSLVDDYNNRRINFSNICLVELEAFGLYDNPRRAEPTSGYLSSSSSLLQADGDVSGVGRHLSPAAEDLGALSMNVRELADMDFLAIDGTRIPVNSRLIARRWGTHFTGLLRESLLLAAETDTATLRPSGVGHPSRNSSITITPSVNSGATTLTANSTIEVPDARSVPPPTRPRIFYLPHTAPTLHALLHYLYTSTLPAPPHQLATPQIFCSLLQLARPYKIDGLLEAVVERLHDSLDGRNAAAIFNAAAMGAGGGEGVQFAPSSASDTLRDSAIPIRAASLAGLDGTMLNGASRVGGATSAATLRIDTEMANGRSTRNTIRPNQALSDESEEEVPDSATTDASMSDFESSSAGLSGKAGKRRETWTGPLSAVVGLQKRGLRGLMEGRRMRERGGGNGKSEGGEGRVGLGE